MITQKDLTGELKGFPLEVVEKMVERQVGHGNKADVKVFQDRPYASRLSGGFNWNETPERSDFWDSVIDKKDFKMFFELYPVSKYPMVMEVSDCEDFSDSVKRVVFMEKNGKFLAWSAETLQDAERTEMVEAWDYAREVGAIEITIQEVADKFGLPVDRIKII